MPQADGVLKFIRGAANATAADAPDAELVQRFASAGDEVAFRALVARYGPMVWSVCRRLTRDHHDAEDAFQAALLVFARKASDLRAGEAVGGWLHAVAYRVASRVRVTRRPEPAETEPSDGPPGGALDELTVREAEAALHEELARLPEKYRAPLVLCCLDGLSRDEAATRLGWSANRVKHGLEQGRELLRSRLARRGIVFGLSLLTGLLSSPASAVPPPLVELAVSHATGTAAPSAAIHSLAQGATRTMWVAKWKWAAVGFAVLALTAGGTLAAILRPAPPEAPPTLPVANAEPIFARAAAPEPKKEQPRDPIDVATAYLQRILDGKPEQALKLADPKAVTGEHAKEIRASELKRVKFVMALVNNARVQVVTERAKLKRRPGADAEDAHVVVVLERVKASDPWIVRGSDVVDEGRVMREIDHYLEGDYNAKKPVPPDPKDAPDPPAPKDPIPARAVAAEFLTLVLAEKDADAVKLCVPGTISENKVGEVRKIGFSAGLAGPTFVIALLNDARVELVSDRQTLNIKANEKAAAHLVLMLTKAKDGAWQVKDIDVRDEERVEQRIKLYFEGRYNDPPPKP